MLFKYRTTFLFITIIIIATNVIYFADLFGNNGQEIIRTVKVKVTTVKETTSNAWDSVKHWDLWDPLEWSEEEDHGEPGDVAQDENGIVHDGSEDLMQQESKTNGDATPSIESLDNHAKVDGKVQAAENQDTRPGEDRISPGTASEPEDAVGSVLDAVDLDQESINGGDVNAASSGMEETLPEATLTPQATSIKDDESTTHRPNFKEHSSADPSETHEPGSTLSGFTPIAATTPGGHRVDDDKEYGKAEIVPEKRKLTLPQLCDETKWTPGLYLACHSHCGADYRAICGGLNNARNRLQTCMRLAIDAGATLILPQATIRQANATGTGLRRVNTASRPPDYFWDIEYLKQSLLSGDGVGKGNSRPGACKQLNIRDWDDWPIVTNTRNLSVPYRRWSGAPFRKGTFRAEIDQTLWKAKVDRKDINAQNPVVLEWSDSFIAWNYDADNEMGLVRAGLFKTLRFNKEVLTLADNVLNSPELAIGFIGIHLRGEADWPAGFGGLNLQMMNYVKAVSNINKGKGKAYKTTTLYVSCGSREAIERFRKYVLKTLGTEYHVVDKWTLLADRPKLLEQVENLGFDRKAIVEYKTLVEAQYFLGIITSTMSNLIAYARTVDHYVKTDEDFFYSVVLKGSILRKDVYRVWRGNRVKMSGDGTTMLMTLKARDIMQRFP